MVRSQEAWDLAPTLLLKLLPSGTMAGTGRITKGLPRGQRLIPGAAWTKLCLEAVLKAISFAKNGER